MKLTRPWLVLTGFLLLAASGPGVAPPGKAAGTADGGNAPSLRLTARTRREIAALPGRWEVTERPVEWAPSKTALIICDVWDKHTCDNATRRTAEMAPRVNDLAKALRLRGALIVHAPSDTMKHYEGTEQRRRAQEAPKVAPPPEAEHACPPLPIDDSDGGCDDDPPHAVHVPPYPWTREHPAIEVAPPDAVTDKGDEVYNLIRQRGIEHVLLCGVHTNMCILNRKFAIKQLVKWGVDVALCRDLTDTMYNPKRPPFVPHARGTDLVVQYVEKFWCPTILSSDVLGDARPAKVVVVTAEQEYDAKDTLPAFAKAELEGRLGMHVTCVNSDSTTDVPGLEALDDADLLVLFMRRRTLPPEQLKRFQAYFDSGRPVVALRTSCHAFQNWLAFDDAVLGCHYNNHYNNGLPVDPAKAGPAKYGAPKDGEAALTHVKVSEKAAADPILRGVGTAFDSAGSLYKVSPLADTATPLLAGTWGDNPAEPVAWTNEHRGGRVFFTSLGHPRDFESRAFSALLRNAVLWALDRPVEAQVAADAPQAAATLSGADAEKVFQVWQEARLPEVRATREAAAESDLNAAKKREVGGTLAVYESELRRMVAEARKEPAKAGEVLEKIKAFRHEQGAVVRRLLTPEEYGAVGRRNQGIAIQWSQLSDDPEGFVRMLDEGFKLTDEQKAKFEPGVKRLAEKVKALAAATASAAGEKERAKAMMLFMDRTDEVLFLAMDVRARIRSALTPEQLKKFDTGFSLDRP